MRNSVSSGFTKRLVFESLEPRLLLSADPLGAAESLAASAILEYHAPINAEANSYTLRFNAGNGDLELLDGDTIVASRALAGTSAVVINGEDLQDDSLTVDFGFGGFFALEDGIEFHGGADGIDLLSVTGGEFGSVTHTATSTGPGRSGSLTYGELVIDYTGLEPIDLTGSGIANLVIDLPGTGDLGILEDNGTQNDGISQVRSGAGTFETTLFSNSVTRLTINLGADDGVFAVAALPDFVNEALTINGQAGADTVVFQGGHIFSSLIMSVGGAVSASSLTIGSGSIVAASLSADTLTAAGGTLSVNAVVNAGELTIGGGTSVAAVNLNQAASIGSLSVNGAPGGGASGGLGGIGNVTLLAGGAHAWNSGVLSGTGSLTVAGGVDDGATLTVGGGNHFLNGKQIINNGVVHWTGGVIDVNGSATFENNGVLELAANANFGGNVFAPNGTLLFTNIGVIRQEAAGSTSFTGGVTLHNQGEVEILAGTVSFGGDGGIHTGSFSAAAGATLAFGGGVHQFQAGSSVTVAGTLLVAGGAVNLDTEVNLSGALVVTGGVADLAPADGSVLPTSITVNGTDATLNLDLPEAIAPVSVSIIGGTANLNSAATIGDLSLAGAGTLGGSADVTLLAGGAHAWTSGTLAGSGVLRVADDATLTVSANNNHFLEGKPIENDGRIRWTGGVIDVNGDTTLANRGEFELAANSVFGNQFAPNGTLVLTNSGVIRQQAGTNTFITGLTLLNDAMGVIDVTAGTLAVTGAITQRGTIDVAANATFRRTGGFANEGLLTGNGTINVGTGILSNSGTVAPGARSGDTTGRLVLTGNYRQEGSGLLDIELASAAAGDFDVLAVSGTATFVGDAALRAELAEGYQPDAGERFRFMTFTARSAASFGSTDLPLHAVVEAHAADLELVTGNLAPQAADDAYATEEDTPLTVAAPGVLGNDADGNQDPLSVVLLSGPENGVLALNADGSFTYVPDAEFFGSDSFTYRVSDGDFDSGVATVFLTVTEGNEVPVANPDSFLVDEDNTLTIQAPGILGNDTDAESATLSAILVSTTANGTLTSNADGSFTYTPNSDFNGTDSFTYRANDGEADSDVATVTLTVNAVNDAPVANPDSFVVDEDGALAVFAQDLLGNDTDVDGDALGATLASGPANGTLTFNPDGSLTYVPNADFSGTDSFTYRADDGAAESAETTVTIHVTAVQDAPVAGDDSFEVDGTLTVGAPGVLGNDADVDSAALTAELVTSTENGVLTLNADGSFSYTANEGFSGTDSFTYRASDGELDSNLATVFLTVAGDDDGAAPVVDAGDDQVVGLQQIDDGYWGHWRQRAEAEVTLSAVFGDLDLADTHCATIDWGDGKITTGHVLEPTADADGAVTGKHTYRKAGTYTVTVTVQDSSGAVSSDTLTVKVKNPIDRRNFDANGDDYRLNEDAVLTVNAAHGVLDNDRGPFGAPVAARVVEGPQHGTLVLNANGSFTYRPDRDFHGQDSFWYEFTDGNNVSRAVEVELCVKSVPEPRSCVDWGDRWKSGCWSDRFMPFGKRWC